MTAYDPLQQALSHLHGLVGLSVLCGLGLLAFTILLSLFGRGRTTFPYERSGPLFTAAERAFLAVLDRAAGDDFLIFGKVRLADLLKPSKGLPRQQFLQALNRVTSKHVDFVLCDPDTYEIVAAIELDDRSHGSQNARSRDEFKNGALTAAGIPLLRVPVRRSYDVAELRDQLAALSSAPRKTSRV